MITPQERLKNLETYKRGILSDLAKLPPYNPEHKEERAFLNEELDAVLGKIHELRNEVLKNG